MRQCALLDEEDIVVIRLLGLDAITLERRSGQLWEVVRRQESLMLNARERSAIVVGHLSHVTRNIAFTQAFPDLEFTTQWNGFETMEIKTVSVRLS